jgi:hypothetical protein
VAEYDKVIPPGQEGEITLEVKGAGIQGEFSKSATITSNDPRNPRKVISISGKIVAYVELQPSSRIYLRGMYGEKVEKEVTLKSNEKQDFEIKKVTSNIDDKITYKVIPTEDPKLYRIKVWKNPKLPTMNLWGTLYIHTNSEHSPEKVVQVSVTTRGAIVVQPSTLNFGTYSPAKAPVGTIEKSITVFKVQGDFHIRNVEFSSDLYEAAVEPLEGGKSYKVTVSFQPGEEKKQYVDEMIIKTDDPQEPSLRVRLLARII